VAAEALPVIRIDAEADAIAREDGGNPDAGSHSGNLAYIL
jgi:hypothetical protein